MRVMAVALAAVGLALSGCGSTPEDRGISGAGIGASAGAILGAVTGLTVLQGAVIGAVAGGLTGAATSKDTINMGEPVWRRRSAANATGEASAAPAEPAATAAPKDDVRIIQTGLNALGYEPGRVDGVAGLRTREAIRAYQRDKKLLVDGVPTPQLAQHIDAEIRKLEQLSRAPVPQ